MSQSSKFGVTIFCFTWDWLRTYQSLYVCYYFVANNFCYSEPVVAVIEIYKVKRGPFTPLWLSYSRQEQARYQKTLTRRLPPPSLSCGHTAVNRTVVVQRRYSTNDNGNSYKPPAFYRLLVIDTRFCRLWVSLTRFLGSPKKICVWLSLIHNLPPNELRKTRSGRAKVCSLLEFNELSLYRPWSFSRFLPRHKYRMKGPCVTMFSDPTDCVTSQVTCVRTPWWC